MHAQNVNGSEITERQHFSKLIIVQFLPKFQLAMF